MAKGISGEVIELSAGGQQPIYMGATEIAKNGFHTADRVGNLVFDNLHPNGISFADWSGSGKFSVLRGPKRCQGAPG